MNAKKVTVKDINRFEKEILAIGREGMTMNQIDPYGVVLQKKIAEFLGK